jgi:type VI secretion system protein ImpA
MAINIEEYLNVYGDNLDGDNAFNVLKNEIKGKPAQYKYDEQSRKDVMVSDAIPPKWSDIKKQSEVLLKRSINLEVIVCYLRALIGLQGFHGLEDGLKLINAIVEKRWDDLYPQLDSEDNNDPTRRINIFLTLCDFKTILKPLEQSPLLESKSFGKFNFRQINIGIGKSVPIGTEDNVEQKTIDAAIQDIEAERLQATLQIISSCFDYVVQLEATLDTYLKKDAPSFAKLHDFLKDVNAFLTKALAEKGTTEEASQNLEVIVEEKTEEKPTVATVSTTKSTQSIAGSVNNNQDVINVLNLVCDYYKKHEPSSPVPFLIERAIRLVGKNFMDMLKDIAPNGLGDAEKVLGKQDDENN